MHQHISVYLNPRAANTSMELWKDKIGRALFRSELSFRTPQNLCELKALLDHDIATGVDAVVAVGGDGTVNTLIQHLAGTQVGLLVVPGGTANDLANELGNRRNIDRVIRCIRSGLTENIDLININGRRMVTNGGLGLGSIVAQAINSTRLRYPLFKKIMKLSGKNIYGLYIARELMTANFASEEYSIECAEFKRTLRSSVILINNQPVLAGMFRIAPETDNADGKFNVTILAHQNRQDLIVCILKIVSGNLPKNDPDLISFETENIQIRRIRRQGQAPLEFFGDGDILGQSDTWNASIDKAALKVYSRRREYGDQLGVRAQAGPSLDFTSLEH